MNVPLCAGYIKNSHTQNYKFSKNGNQCLAFSSFAPLRTSWGSYHTLTEITITCCKCRRVLYWNWKQNTKFVLMFLFTFQRSDNSFMNFKYPPSILAVVKLMYSMDFCMHYISNMQLQMHTFRNYTLMICSQGNGGQEKCTVEVGPMKVLDHLFHYHVTYNIPFIPSSFLLSIDNWLYARIYTTKLF